MIVCKLVTNPNVWPDDKNLDDWLVDQNLLGICVINTRNLARRIKGAVSPATRANRIMEDHLHAVDNALYSEIQPVFDAAQVASAIKGLLITTNNPNQ